MIYPYAYPFTPEMMPLWHITVFIVGTCIGSFLNVCIWRIPRGESIANPPSHCPKCNHVLSWYENIPLVSWTVLGGKCRKCKLKIPFRYFAVELLTGVMFFLVWFKVIINHEPLPLVIIYFVITMLVICTIFIDAVFYIIPNEITFPAIVFGLIWSIIFPSIWNTDSHLWAFLYSLRGFAVGFIGFAIFAIIGKLIFKKEALGWGDVKFLGAIGACLGGMACLFSVLVGSIAGAIAGTIVIIYKKEKFSRAIPFGPFLAGAVYLWILFGPLLLGIYFGWLKELRNLFQ